MGDGGQRVAQRRVEFDVVWVGLTCEVLVWATVALRFAAEACNK